MPKFVIEREIPGAGALTGDQLQAISQKSCGVLRNLGPQIQWLQSYVTDNKIYCVYICLLYTSPSPRDPKTSRMPSSA